MLLSIAYLQHMQENFFTWVKCQEKRCILFKVKDTLYVQRFCGLSVFFTSLRHKV